MNPDTRRISTPAIKITETENSFHQFRSLRVDNRNNFVKSSSIILETNEPKICVLDNQPHPERPTSTSRSISRISSYSKSLSRNNSKYSSKKTILKDGNDRSSVTNTNNGQNLTTNLSNSNLNRSVSTSNVIVHEQYWSCCSRKWTRCEKILVITVSALVIIILGLIILIGIISRKEDDYYIM